MNDFVTELRLFGFKMAAVGWGRFKITIGKFRRAACAILAVLAFA